MAWANNSGCALEGKGFKVKQDLYATRNDIIKAWKDPDIHGFVFIGHSVGIGLQGFYTNEFSVRPEHTAPPYKIAYLNIRACFSLHEKWAAKVSKNGRFFGFSGQCDLLKDEAEAYTGKLGVPVNEKDEGEEK